MKRNLSAIVTAVLLVLLMLVSSLALLPLDIAYAQGDNMSFTSGEKIDFTTDQTMTFKGYEDMQFWSGVKMKFSTNIKMRFIETMPDGIIDACDWLVITWPIGYIPDACSWWEIIDPRTLEGLGEFHIDFWEPPDMFHIDIVWPGPIQVPPGAEIHAIKKIDIIEPCEYFEVHWPSHWWPEPCSWWEIMDPETGEHTGYEFHVDWTNESCEFHIDEMIPGPYILPFPWYEVWARRKIPGIKPCDYFVVEEPEHWWPEPCTWWEIMDPWTSQPTGYNFHVDWTNESCEFHIDQMHPTALVFEPPVPYVIAEKKIIEIKPCDWFIIVDPPGFLPDQCSWWEILNDTGAPTGLEFHVDMTDGIEMFHVDIVEPGEIITIPPSYTVTVRKKIDIIEPCNWFRVDDPSLTPEPCSWWEIMDPDTGESTGFEFHVDESLPGTGLFHVDIVWPGSFIPRPIYQLTAERKIDDINPCDWFVVVDPPTGWVPEPCSWWEITWPTEWAGITFHVDANDGISQFHIDFVDNPPAPPYPPSWWVTAKPYEEPTDPWYIKPPYPDYAPSGMPDFDQRQWGTYIWQDIWGAWSHCGPVACANSLWWYDSKYEYYYNPSSPPPPVYSDNFPLVQSYGGPPWDDHDPQNLPFLVEHLAWLMDCDALRTGPFTGAAWSGTYVHDMEAGLAQYLSWSGVNPHGDANGDGIVDIADANIVNAAMGTAPGMPGWDLRADMWPASTVYPPWSDQRIDVQDLNLVMANMGMVGIFYEHTAHAWEDWEFFWFIEDEVHRCQDVVLLLGFYIEGTDIREGGHYVTVAGVNSTTMELLISNPIRDDFEAGITPGRSPIPHVHLPPEPPYTTHNDAGLVSQDAYHVTLMPSPSGYHFILDRYFDPPFEARIEYAVITSEIEPLPEPDIAVTNLTICHGQTIIPQNRTRNINVTVTNEGPTDENFTLTVHWNTTNVIASTSVSLLAGQTKIVTFTWNPNQPRYMNYTLSAHATPVPGETDTADNTFIDGTVTIVYPGDVDADKDIDIYDVVKITGIYASKYGDPQFKPNSDLDCNGEIQIYDVVICTSHYGYVEPP